MSESPTQDCIEVDGEAVISVVPDHATITLVVKDRQNDLSAAKCDVDRRCAAIIQLAKRLDVAAKDLSASQISIAPEYEWRQTEKTFLGTSVSRDITIVLRNLSQYCELINELASIPITHLRRVELDVENRIEIERAASRKAVSSARESAIAIADELGVRLGRPIRVGSRQSYYIGGAASRDLDHGSDAFEPGAIDIKKELSVMFSIEHPN